MLMRPSRTFADNCAIQDGKIVLYLAAEVDKKKRKKKQENYEDHT